MLIDGRYVFQDELEALKTKLDKLETERTSLKHENDKLEAKVSTAKRRKVSGSTTLTFDLAMAPSFSGLSPKNVSVAVARRSFSVVGARLKNLQHKKSKRSGRGPASGIIRERERDRFFGAPVYRGRKRNRVRASPLFQSVCDGMSMIDAHGTLCQKKIREGLGFGKKQLIHQHLFGNFIRILWRAFGNSARFNWGFSVWWRFSNGSGENSVLESWVILDPLPTTQGSGLFGPLLGD